MGVMLPYSPPSSNVVSQHQHHLSVVNVKVRCPAV